MPFFAVFGCLIQLDFLDKKWLKMATVAVYSHFQPMFLSEHLVKALLTFYNSKMAINKAFGDFCVINLLLIYCF